MIFRTTIVPAEQRGVAALLTVILIGVMVMTIGITAAFVGQTEVIVGGQTDYRNQVLMLASACLDEGAFRLKLDSSYTGSTVPIGATDTCVIAVSGSGATRTLTATASSGDHTRSVVVTATRKQNAAANAHAWSLGAWAEADAP